MIGTKSFDDLVRVTVQRMQRWDRKDLASAGEIAHLME
jgi:hypothetical protein